MEAQGCQPEGDKYFYAGLQENPKKSWCQRKNVPLFEEYGHNQLVYQRYEGT